MAKLKSTHVYGTLVVDDALTVTTDATITGNLTVNGNTSYTNVITTTVSDPIVEYGGGANNAGLLSDDGKDRGSLLHYYNGGAVDAFMGWKNTAGEFVVASNVSISDNIVTVNTYGNLHAGYFKGDGSALTSITGANVTGYVPNANHANVAGYVDQATQSNITLLGTQTSLTVSGTSNVADINANGIVNVSNSTSSTSTSTGALVVAGGVGIGGNLWVGGTVHANIAGTTSAPGSNTQVSFNDNGTTNATPGFTFNKVSNTVSTTDLVLSGKANVGTDINMTNSTASINGTTLTANGSTQLNLQGSSSNITLNTSGAVIKSTGGNVALNNSGDFSVSTGNLNLPNANISSTGTANLGGALNVSETANVSNVIARNFSENQIAFSDGTSKLVGSNDFKYETGAQRFTVPTANISNVNANTIKSSDLTAGRVTFATTNGQLTDSGNLAFNTTTNTLSVPNATLSGTANAANVIVTTLTSGRVTYATTNGQLIDSANLAFNDGTNTLSVPNVTMSGTANAAEVIVTSLTATRVPFVDVDKSLTDDSGFTFSSGVLTVTGNVAAGNIKTDHLLYANGSPWDLQEAAGSNTQIQYNDGLNNFGASANFTFANDTNTLTVGASGSNVVLAAGNITSTGTANIGGELLVTGNANISTNLKVTQSANVVVDLHVGGNANVVGTLKAGDTTISGNLTVTGTTTSVNTTVSQLSDPLFDLGNGANGAALSTDDGMDRGLVMHTYSGGTVDVFMGYKDSMGQFLLAKNVTVANNVVSYGTTDAEKRANLADITLGNIYAYNANFGGVVFSNGNVTLGSGSSFVGNLAGNVTGNLYGNISGNFTVTGGNGAIQFADASNTLTSSAGLNFNSGSNTLTVGNTVSATYLTGTLTTNAQPNVTSLGTLTGLAIDGNLSIGNATASWGIKTDNLYYSNGVAWDLQQAAGSNNQIQFNEGNNFSASSNFTFDPASNTLAVTGTANVSGDVNAGNVFVAGLTSGRVTFAGTDGKLVDNTNFTFTGGNTLTVTGVGNITTVNASNVSVSTLTGGRVTFADNTNKLVDSAQFTFDAASNTLTTITANVTTLNSSNIVNSGDITSGNVYANSGTVKATYLTGTLTTASQPNVTSVGTLTSLTVSGVTDLNTVANVRIAGGTAGQYLVATDNTGNVTWQTLDTSIIANGSSNVTIASANGSVKTNVAGNLIVEVTGTGANVTGTIDVSGNVNANNVNASNLITANANIDSTSSITGTVKVTGGIGATGNIYTGHSVGFADGTGNSASAAYIQFNATANSLDFIFN